MTASSPVTMQDLVNGLKLSTSEAAEGEIVDRSGEYFIYVDPGDYNTVSLSSDGLTITFGDISFGGPTFTGFTFNE